jgi:hypothetical protein
MIVTNGSLAHEPLVIVLQHLRMDCGRKQLDFVENGSLFALNNAYGGKTAGVRGRHPLALLVVGFFLPRNRTLHVIRSQRRFSSFCGYLPFSPVIIR